MPVFNFEMLVKQKILNLSTHVSAFQIYENVHIIRGHPSYWVMIFSTALLNFQVIMQNSMLLMLKGN